MKEKYELLYKIDSLKKKGIQIPGNVTIESSIDEIKYNLHKKLLFLFSITYQNFCWRV